MHQDKARRRIPIDRVAVTVERKRNDEQVRRTLLRGIVKTVLEFHPAAEKCSRCVEMFAI